MGAASTARISTASVFSRASKDYSGVWLGASAFGGALALGGSVLFSESAVDAEAPFKDLIPPPQFALWSNVPLGDKHKIALCEWPADQSNHNGDPRTASIDALFTWVRDSGYDGVEMSCGYFASRYFRNMPLEKAAACAKEAAERYGLEIFGTNVWWCYDFGDEDMNWGKQLMEMRREIGLTKAMGGKYVTFQMWLPPKYLNTGGSYRRDDDYLDLVARRIEDLHAACWEQGMNCYIETHVDRVTEDPEAFNKIVDRCRIPNVEVNGDVSHYIYRAFRPDAPDVARILSKMGHTHQRLARAHGDLSADCKKPKKDWKERGLTWQAFHFSKAGLEGGLSSRVICGESGPMHGVDDPLTLDAKLVPLYRFMASYADASAKGKAPNIQSPDDVKNPWKTKGKIKLKGKLKKEEKKKKKKRKKDEKDKKKKKIK